MLRFRTIVRLAGFAIAVTAACGTTALAQSNSAPGISAAASAKDVVEAARKRVASGDLPGALAALAVYVGQHPREVAAGRYLGDLYYRTGDAAEAERTYLAIVAVAPGDRETHNRLGGLYAAVDRVPEAIAEFQKSLPDEGAFGHLADLHRRLGDLDRFEATYRRAAENAPNDAAAQYAFGSVLRSEHKSNEAVVVLERALRIAPQTCAPLAELGSAYLDLGRVGQAIDVLQQCLSISPNDYAALVNIADAYIALGQFDRAQPRLTSAIDVRPDGPEALVDLGYLQDIGTHWQSAIAYYLRAITADPLAREAYVDLGYDYDQHRQFPLAEAAFLKGLSVSPSDGRLHYLLAVTYADQGKRDLARSEYQRAAASSDEPAVARAAVQDLSTLQ
ncbi:MAG: tetratricopeptide repeat protein [Candidatus Eremiobacteraeota bacterium]|nr:tetratricopeptide repeat protein [Candidatus Eremiobacteraeota bacterium]